ncbi:MAG TPA: DUF6794 domain-containing protein [Pyrinomonadaceae bacterium]|nr:DUF6794 domain-containing protein [Pyrinomonadaceae bacterium]
MFGTRLSILVLVTLLTLPVVMGQASSSGVEIIKVYSENERFYLESIPYDNEFPTLRGRTSVFENGNVTALYVFERGFDSVDEHTNNLILSNDGKVIFYAIPWGANEEKEGLKSVTIYKNGKIEKSFTEADIHGCDLKQERCHLLYSNYDAVVDRERSNVGSRSYKKVFKTGVSDQERFLSDFPIFAFDDTVYLIDSKKKVHVFDLKQGSYVRSDPFTSIFDHIKTKGRFNRVELTRYDAPLLEDFPKLKDGADTYEKLATILGMKPASILETTDEQYKLYSFRINGTLSKTGLLEIEEIEFWGGQLPQPVVAEFFKGNRFDSSWIPKEFDKWNLGEEYFYFRKSDDVVARQEKQLEIIEEAKELERRTTVDTINGVYIPANLLECFVELDKLLDDIDKKEMRALSSRKEMIQYHMGLGMWVRNNWGLWSGSRLQKYFTARGVTHPDHMSGVILNHYFDWLTGKKQTWKDWEKSQKGPASLSR